MNPTKEQLTDPKWWDEHAPTWATRLMRNAAVGSTPNCWADDSKKALWVSDHPGAIFGLDESCWRLIATRPTATPQWNGEGLPPVGARCEAAIPHTSGPDNERSFIWIEGSVIAYHEIKGKTYAWFAEDDGFYHPNVLEFRPVRTPEQIAAEEREKAIAEMVEACSYPSSMHTFADCETLYDAGYRKVEGVAQ